MAVIGDTSFLNPENAYRADNNVLIGNVADFLVEGNVSENPFQEPPTGGGSTPGSGTSPGGFQPPTDGGSGVTAPDEHADAATDTSG